MLHRIESLEYNVPQPTGANEIKIAKNNVPALQQRLDELADQDLGTQKFVAAAVSIAKDAINLTPVGRAVRRGEIGRVFKQWQNRNKNSSDTPPYKDSSKYDGGYLGNAGEGVFSPRK